MVNEEARLLRAECFTFPEPLPTFSRPDHRGAKPWVTQILSEELEPKSHGRSRGHWDCKSGLWSIPPSLVSTACVITFLLLLSCKSEGRSAWNGSGGCLLKLSQVSSSLGPLPVLARTLNCQSEDTAVHLSLTTELVSELSHIPALPEPQLVHL